MSSPKHVNYIPITNHKSGTNDDLCVTIYPDEYGFGGGRRLIRNPGTRIMPFTEAAQRLAHGHEKATIELVRDSKIVMDGLVRFSSDPSRVTPVYFVYPWYMEDETPDRFTLELVPSPYESHHIGVAVDAQRFGDFTYPTNCRIGCLTDHYGKTNKRTIHARK